nr:hypothetical protein [Tanacetum cinerariifolium]
WDLHSSGSGNTLHWQWELILPVGTLSWQWECLVHFIPNRVRDEEVVVGEGWFEEEEDDKKTGKDGLLNEEA